MSQENVELLHQAIDAFNRRDLDAYLALNDSELEFTPDERAIEGLAPFPALAVFVPGGTTRSRPFPTSSRSFTSPGGLVDFTVGRGRLAPATDTYRPSWSR
jgi:hypothetical protein